MALPQPAHSTKHVPLLLYPFQRTALHLAQRADGVHNGTALWLGGQCLAHYLAYAHLRFRSPSSLVPRVVELGSGIGLTALALGSLGWNVLATDVGLVVQTVLNKNIKANRDVLPLGSGQIDVRELDWTVPAEAWHWDNPLSITSPSTESHPEQGISLPFDLIISADTVYESELVTPLLRTIHALSTSSFALSRRYPSAILCLERRDPALVDSLLAAARDTWGFSVDRVPRAKLAKCLEKGGLRWESTEWEGVEIWKLRLK